MFKESGCDCSDPGCVSPQLGILDPGADGWAASQDERLSLIAPTPIQLPSPHCFAHVTSLLNLHVSVLKTKRYRDR